METILESLEQWKLIIQILNVNVPADDKGQPEASNIQKTCGNLICLDKNFCI